MLGVVESATLELIELETHSHNVVAYGATVTDRVVSVDCVSIGDWDKGIL